MKMRFEKQVTLILKANVIRITIDLGKTKKLEYFVIKINDYFLKNNQN